MPQLAVSLALVLVAVVAVRAFLKVLQGRISDPAAAANEHPVAVVDEHLASRLWPGESAPGRSLATYVPTDRSLKWHEVVGVIGAIRGPLSEGYPDLPYFPWSQAQVSNLVLIGPGRMPDQQLLASLREVAGEADPDVGVLQAPRGTPGRRTDRPPPAPGRGDRHPRSVGRPAWRPRPHGRQGGRRRRRPIEVLRAL